ncbi:hypothetical protein F5888DRAFT_1804158 [Russula emetica]|nr:hypothetical protein F5888DRAFT_1804158 [Russula emetica]
MSHAHPAVSSSSSSSSNVQLIISNALDAYKKRTKNDLLAHPLAAELQYCNTPSAILAVLQQQFHGLDQSRSSDDRWTRWLDPTVNVLFALSATLGEGVGLVFSPAKVVFAGVGVLLSAAKDARASQDILIDVFERIEMFFRRLEIYTEVPPSSEMMDIIVRIMAEVLSVLGIAMKEIKQGRMKKFAKKLIGRTGIEDALKRLDKLTQDEVRMATAQPKAMDDSVASVDNKVAEVIADVKKAKLSTHKTAKGIDQVQRFRRWLCPPDPSTNYNIAYSAHHEGTATWFFQGNIFKEWKSSGSLLWIHGKPGSGKSILCSTIIQDIRPTCKDGRALMAYFYFDFRDAKKQHWNDLFPREGDQQPSNHDLTRCLKQMLTFPDQCPIYLIMDALDESLNTSGIPSPREMVLQLLKELVDLSLPNLHICVTSRPEFDIRNVLEPLTSRRVSLHDQSGQKEDIAEYVRSIVYSDSEQIMRRWRTEDKELVIKTLSERADGMFRWAFCQLETLRHCLPPSIRRTLDELPESLDDIRKNLPR